MSMLKERVRLLEMQQTAAHEKERVLDKIKNLSDSTYRQIRHLEGENRGLRRRINALCEHFGITIQHVEELQVKVITDGDK